MKNHRSSLWLAILLIFPAFHAPAATLYVDGNGANPVPPYAGWSTAATNIQDAVDAANPGDTVLVTNGVYDTGSRTDEYGVPSRVAVAKAITVQSVNGPAVSIIEGDQLVWLYYPYISTGSNVRCVYLTNGVLLSGFTLTNGASTGSGGGAFCESTNAVLEDCVIVSNTTPSGGADTAGGGVYSGTVIGCSISNNVSTGYGTGGGVWSSVATNCIINNNSAFIGGGAETSTLYNCTVSGNSGNHSGTDGSTLYDCIICYNSNGGASGGTLYNCALYGNASFAGACAMNNCTVFDNPGVGNYQGTANNCILYDNSGGNYSGATLNYCCTTPLPTNGIGNITNEPEMASLTHLSAESPCIGAGSNAYATGVDIDGDAWADPPSIGCDEYHPGAVTGPLTASIQADNTAVAPGFTVNFTAQISGRTTGSAWIFDGGTTVSNMPLVSHSWSTYGNHTVLLKAYNESYPDGVIAAQIVQVLGQFFVNINNANPAPPYMSWADAATNIQDAINVATPGSVILVSNGVYQTGEEVVRDTTPNRVAITKPLTVASVNGPAVTTISGGWNVRCVYLTNGAALAGFTVTGGNATSGSANSDYDLLGGGIIAEDQTGTVNNCIIAQNTCSYYGGGAYNGTLINCLVEFNSAGAQGGGTYNSNLRNCTVVQNSAEIAGGTAWGTLDNCIVYYNSSSPFPETNYLSCSFVNCCTTPDSGGIDDITNAPLFANLAGGDFHLQSNSPCINAGNNAYVTNAADLDGNPRIAGGTVDIGAYEYQTPTSILSYAWLEQYGLPTDGSADFEDLDGTGMNNWQKWIAGLNPTNPVSVLAMLPTMPATNNPAGLVVSWQSMANITYFLQSSTNLGAQPAFSTIESNIAGQTGVTSYTDTNAVGNGPFFYRIGVQQ